MTKMDKEFPIYYVKLIGCSRPDVLVRAVLRDRLRTVPTLSDHLGKQ